jgi:hypothetical protein
MATKKTETHDTPEERADAAVARTLETAVEARALLEEATAQRDRAKKTLEAALDSGDVERVRTAQAELALAEHHVVRSGEQRDRAAHQWFAARRVQARLRFEKVGQAAWDRRHEADLAAIRAARSALREATDRAAARLDAEVDELNPPELLKELDALAEELRIPGPVRATYFDMGRALSGAGAEGTVHAAIGVNAQNTGATSRPRYLALLWQRFEAYVGAKWGRPVAGFSYSDRLDRLTNFLRYDLPNLKDHTFHAHEIVDLREYLENDKRDEWKAAADAEARSAPEKKKRPAPRPDQDWGR